MTVQELIDRLKEFDPALPVFVSRRGDAIDVEYAALSRIDNAWWEIAEEEDYNEPLDTHTHTQVVGLYEN